MKQACIYERCGQVERLNDDGLCPRCASILEKVQKLIKQNLLPKMPSAQLGPSEKIRTTGIRRLGSGMPCAACDQPIAEEHWAYPNFPGDRRYDLHFHDLCDEIWEKEATET